MNEIRFRLRNFLSRTPVFPAARSALNRVRNPLWEAKVLRHRNRIREEARRRGVQYRAVEAAKRIRANVTRKGIKPKAKGELRIFTAYWSQDWTGEQLLSAFQRFGQVRHFDLENEPDRFTWFRERRTEMNRRLLEAVSSWHRGKPVDVFFYYGGGLQILTSTLQAINDLGIATMCMSADDTSGLAGEKLDGVDTKLASIAPYFDMCYTTTLAACEEYLLIGAQPYYLPLAANPNVYRRMNVPKDIGVAIFGQAHGVRRALVRDLRRKGVQVQGYGPGWPSGRLSIEKLVELINRAEIVLGHGHHSSFGESARVQVTCLKGRDLEIPMCGALYVTTFDPELQLWFAIGEQIICYRTVDDLTDTIHYLLDNPARMEQIREAAWQRAHREHTWERRIQQLFETLGVLV